MRDRDHLGQFHIQLRLRGAASDSEEIQPAMIINDHRDTIHFICENESSRSTSAEIFIEDDRACSIRSNDIEKIAELHSAMNATEFFKTLEAAMPMKTVDEPVINHHALDGLEEQISDEIDFLSRLKFDDTWWIISPIPIGVIIAVSAFVIWRIRRNAGSEKAHSADEAGSGTVDGTFVSYLKDEDSTAEISISMKSENEVDVSTKHQESTPTAKPRFSQVSRARRARLHHITIAMMCVIALCLDSAVSERIKRKRALTLQCRRLKFRSRRPRRHRHFQNPASSVTTLRRTIECASTKRHSVEKTRRVKFIVLSAKR